MTDMRRFTYRNQLLCRECAETLVRQLYKNGELTTEQVRAHGDKDAKIYPQPTKAEGPCAACTPSEELVVDVANVDLSTRLLLACVAYWGGALLAFLSPLGFVLALVASLAILRYVAQMSGGIAGGQRALWLLGALFFAGIAGPLYLAVYGDEKSVSRNVESCIKWYRTSPVVLLTVAIIAAVAWGAVATFYVTNNR